MSPSIRRQLTMFVPHPDATAIESIRSHYNPAQRAIIDSHVTLCREDELTSLDQVLQNLKILQQPPLTIRFGDIIPSEGGKGVLLPAVAGREEFHRVRQILLQDITNNPREMEPHITLMHPRNSTCNDAIFEEIRSYKLPKVIQFDAISLIEQVDGGPWQVQHTYKLIWQ